MAPVKDLEQSPIQSAQNLRAYGYDSVWQLYLCALIQAA